MLKKYNQIKIKNQTKEDSQDHSKDNIWKMFKLKFQKSFVKVQNWRNI